MATGREPGGVSRLAHSQLVLAGRTAAGILSKHFTWVILFDTHTTLERGYSSYGPILLMRKSIPK